MLQTFFCDFSTSDEEAKKKKITSNHENYKNKPLQLLYQLKPPFKVKLDG